MFLVMSPDCTAPEISMGAWMLSPGADIVFCPWKPQAVEV